MDPNPAPEIDLERLPFDRAAPWANLLDFYEAVACVCAFPRACHLASFRPHGRYVIDGLDLVAVLRARAWSDGRSFVVIPNGRLSRYRCQRCGSVWREQFDDPYPIHPDGMLWWECEDLRASRRGAPVEYPVPLHQGLCGPLPLPFDDLEREGSIRKASAEALAAYLRTVE